MKRLAANLALAAAIIGLSMIGAMAQDTDSPGVYDEKGSLDVMADALKSDPQLKSHIILYRSRYSPVSETNANIIRIRKYLVEIHKLDAKRISIVDGGRRLDPRSQIYKVPPGADAPMPTPDEFPENDPVLASKIDEFGAVKVEIEMVILDTFAEEIKNRVTDDAFVMVYRARNGRPGDAQSAIDRIRTHLVKKHGMDANRLKTIDAGIKDKFTVELWAVPPNSTQQ